MIAARIGKVLIVIRLHLQGSDARAEFPNLLKNVVADRSRWELAGSLQQLRGYRFQVLHLFSVRSADLIGVIFPAIKQSALARSPSDREQPVGGAIEPLLGGAVRAV